MMQSLVIWTQFLCGLRVLTCVTQVLIMVPNVMVMVMVMVRVRVIVRVM